MIPRSVLIYSQSRRRESAINSLGRSLVLNKSCVMIELDNNNHATCWLPITETPTDTLFLVLEMPNIPYTLHVHNIMEPAIHMFISLVKMNDILLSLSL